MPDRITIDQVIKVTAEHFGTTPEALVSDRRTEHFLPEPEERVRDLRADEDAALEEQMDPEYEMLRRFSLASGLRRNESLLRWPQVDLKANRIALTGKGGRLIFLPITSEMREILLSRVGHQPDFVFMYVCKLSRRSPERVSGQRYAEGLKTHWRHCRAAAGITDFRWHDHRHTFATQLLRATKNLKLVQRGMNHRKIATTAKYAHVMDEDLLAGMETASQERRGKSQQNPQPQKKSQGNQRRP